VEWMNRINSKISNPSFRIQHEKFEKKGISQIIKLLNKRVNSQIKKEIEKNDKEFGFIVDSRSSAPIAVSLIYDLAYRIIETQGIENLKKCLTGN
jgi:hypothetical protein